MFLHPLALLGLAAAAIPALLHLLQRRTPPELVFPPLRYLSEAERQSARRLKLRHLLLLILRTALIVVIVLAAARPLVPVRGGGAHEPTAVVVILDNSPSSGTVVDGRPILDRLRASARSSLARVTPADRAWLMLADGVLRGGSRDALLASADSATPGWQRLDLVQAVERAARLVHAEPLPGREVHLLSDLQRSALAGNVDVPRGVRILALGPGWGGDGSDRALPNRGIASVRVSEGAAVVAVTGSGGAGAVPVSLRMDGGSGRGLATPGTALSITLPPQSMTTGWRTGEATLEPDELRADDRRPFVWRVAPPARVTATAAAGPFVGAALTVLREGGRISDGRDVVIGDAPSAARSIVQPPEDPALIGQANRALGARGIPWRWGVIGTPGRIVSTNLAMIEGSQVSRRYQILGEGEQGSGDVLATVNGEPWIARADEGGGGIVLIGSRLDTSWTALPATPGFVPLIDALVNRVVAGEADVREAEGAPRVEYRVRGTDTVAATVYGPDPRESDLTPASGAIATAAFGGRDQADIMDERRFSAEAFAGTRRADASAALLILALLLVATELGVATRTR
jgi:hypothetical protein